MRIWLQSDGGTCRSDVSNTATEIAAEHLPRLFDRFYRVDDSRQRQDEGAGLGLAITRSIIQRASAARSALHLANGTCFRLDRARLPDQG
jgi:two-component system heavy metal sensor histidine kinase CusS